MTAREHEPLSATLETSRGALAVVATWTGDGYRDVRLTLPEACGCGALGDPILYHPLDCASPVPLSSLTDDERERLDVVLAQAAQGRARMSGSNFGEGDGLEAREERSRG